MSDMVGQTLGKYQLVERLGRGGMASVYKGYQPGLERYVAIKVLHAHLAEDEHFITRFRREAKIVADLRHPNIVQVFDFDVQGENYYMAMEFVDGPTLKTTLSDLNARSEVLGLRTSLDVAAQLANALDYAHGEGMVHRDVKPANVLMRRPDQPILSDFGIARIVGASGLTASGAMVGTPAYMSPEQGRGEKADARSDIYALGIVLYEMLAGSPPYDADTPYAVILKHINDPIPIPRERVQGLPEQAEAVVLKALAKDPNDRFTTPGDMRNVLRDLLATLTDTPISLRTPPAGVAAQTAAGQPVAAVGGMETPVIPPPAVMSASAPRKSRWWMWVAAAVVSIGLLAGAALVGINLLGSGEASGPVSGLPASGPAGDAISGEIEEIAANLAQEGVERFSEGEHDFALDLFEQALVADPFNVEALVGRAVIVMEYDNPGEAAELLDRALEVAPDDSFANYGLGLLHFQTEEFYDEEAAFDAFTQTIDECGNVAWLCAAGYSERANVRAWAFEDVEGALDDVNRAIELQPDPFAIPYYYASRAEYREHLLGDVEGAIEDYETGYSLSEGEYWMLEEAAGTALMLGDFDRAVSLIERLLEDSVGDPLFLSELGYIQWRAGLPNDAIAIAERALELDPELLGARYVLGLVLLDRGQPEEALAQFMFVSEEPDMYLYAFPFLNTEFGHHIFFDMARAAVALGDAEQALEWVHRSLADDEYWVEPHILQGEIFEAQGSLAEARDSYVMALEIANEFGEFELADQIEGRLLALSN